MPIGSRFKRESSESESRIYLSSNVQSIQSLAHFPSVNKISRSELVVVLHC